MADIDHDYVAVAELMGGIVSEASGVGIEPQLQQTINAVKLATAGQPEEYGATAFQIATELKLDKSAAWRRLGVAMNKGYVVNLETRPRQRGKYRVTDQEIIPEPLLPSADALKGVMQTTQTRKRSCKPQPIETLNDCASVCTIAPIASPQDDPEPGAFEPDFEERNVA